MGKLSNYTLAGIEAQLYPGRAEFARKKGSKDKAKRKRSLRDNIMGTTTAGRIARGVGAAGALALGGKALLKRYGKKAAAKPGLGYAEKSRAGSGGRAGRDEVINPGGIRTPYYGGTGKAF